MDTTRYYLGFNLTPGIGPARIARLVAYCGTIEAAWNADLRTLHAAGLEPKLATALLASRRTLDLDAIMADAAAQDVQLIGVEDAQYPERLRSIAAPPPLLYVRGSLTVADSWAIAVVGTRSPTSYGREATHVLVQGLAEAGVTIVSGLAIGIDSAAHVAALEAGGRTIGVLASGVDRPYPERNRRLAHKMLSQGALISDYPLGTAPAPLNFPPRNRLISGLAAGVLVVEAGEKSGSLITVDFALEQGREVFAVPGHLFSRASAGTHQLIREGATLVTSVQDILDALGWHQTALPDVEAELPPDDPQEAAILRQLGPEPQHIDVLVRETGLSAPDVSALLAMLELKGSVRQIGAMQFVRNRH